MPTLSLPLSAGNCITYPYSPNVYKSCPQCCCCILHATLYLHYAPTWMELTYDLATLYLHYAPIWMELTYGLAAEYRIYGFC